MLIPLGHYIHNLHPKSLYIWYRPPVHLFLLFNIFTSLLPQHAPITLSIPFMLSFRLYLPKQLPERGWGLFPSPMHLCFLWQTDGSVRFSVCKLSWGEAREQTTGWYLGCIPSSFSDKVRGSWRRFPVCGRFEKILTGDFPWGKVTVVVIYPELPKRHCCAILKCHFDANPFLKY